MELLNVAAEQIVQAQPDQAAVMQRLLNCEGQVPGETAPPPSPRQ